MAIHDCFFVVLLCNAGVDELCGLLSGNLLTRGAWSQGIPVVNRAIPLQNIVNC